MSTYVDLIAWDDCPHLQPPYLSKEELNDFEQSLSAHERSARRTGKPGLGAGAVYPVEEEKLLIDPFKIPDYYERAWTMDVGWNCTAALLGARDPDTDITYLTHEYYQGQCEPPEHARNILAMLPWTDLTGGMDPAAENSNQKDGSKLIQDYRNLGLSLKHANNAVADGLHQVLVLMQTGQLKVFNTLVYWLKEYRLYSRDKKTHKIVKKNDHLMDCMRYLIATPGLFTTRAYQDALAGAKQGEF